ncbi:hypothetical protein [Streptomyces prasinopilosus]|uniref:hypothetical protein n=1 Tax=Streptomyces prasinopilosus TaxID=67344 RepID=UPI0006EBC517|nr:hypothetical protein [Streptomyces prasinopilosus]
MGQGDATEDNAANAAAGLRHLSKYFREHPVTGPDGHSYISNQPRATATNPGMPLNVRVLEHIDRTVAEVAAYTREVNPDAEPLPDDVLDVYRWCVENTVHAPEIVQQRREVLEYQHSLEHAVAAGDTDVIPPHPCPDCRTWGLMWDKLTRRIVCTNRRCVDEEGLSTTITFARLAHEHVTARKNLRDVRAT